MTVSLEPAGSEWLATELDANSRLHHPSCTNRRSGWHTGYPLVRQEGALSVAECTKRADATVVGLREQCDTTYANAAPERVACYASAKKILSDHHAISRDASEWVAASVNSILASCETSVKNTSCTDIQASNGNDDAAAALEAGEASGAVLASCEEVRDARLATCAEGAEADLGTESELVKLIEARSGKVWSMRWDRMKCAASHIGAPQSRKSCREAANAA